MNILYSYECTELLPEIASALYNEFQADSYENILESLKDCTNNSSIPITLVAVDNGKFVGTISIIDYDIHTRKDLTPWIADLFIVPEYRNAGVLIKLFDLISEEVTRLKIKQIYLYTAINRHCKYYSRLGFEYFEKMAYLDKEITIMVKHNDI